MIAWFTRNGVAANLLMLVLLLGGLGSILSVKRELFPQFSLDTIIVRVPFLGASPEEVEEQVVIRIEEALQGVDGIKEITSTASENYGSVAVTVARGYELSKVKDDIKTRVDAIPSFPADTERPIIEELLIQKDVIRISVFGKADEADIKKIATRVRDDLANLSGISQVNVDSARQYEISINVSELSLRKHGLTFNQVVNAVSGNSLDLPGGVIKAEGGEIQLRTQEQAYREDEFGDIALLSRLDGSTVLLRDVAEVIDGFEETDVYTKFNGKPAAIVLVREVGNENPLEISKKVYEYVENAQETWVPEGIQLEAWSDSSFYLQGRIDMLLENGFYGFVLVLISLTIFLRPSLAFFVAIGIPISFLATLAIAPIVGISINMLSLFAFILVLGIVVDDAIVVGESVFTEFQKNGPGTDSAVRGTHKVSTPVTFAVITTMVAFIPVFLLPGTIGKFMAVIPYVVIPTLAFSLVQSKLVLPYHLSLCHVGDKAGREKLNRFSRFQRYLSDWLERFVNDKYQPLLKKALTFRYTTLAIAIAVLAFSITLVVVGVIRFVFFPAVPSDYIFMELNMKEGTSITETSRGLDAIERALENLRADDIANGKNDPVKNKGTFLGYSVVSGGPEASSFSSGSNVGSIIIELAKSEVRDSNADEIAERWRNAVGVIPGAKRVKFLSSASGPVGLPVDVRLIGPDLEDLKAASIKFQNRLNSIDGMYDISDTFSEGKTELKLSLKESAHPLGLNAVDLGRQVRNAFYGAESQRIQRDQEEVKVMVRYPRDERQSLGNLEQMQIVAPSGARIPIGEVADIEMGTGYPSISRIDRQRVINVQADTVKEKLSTDEVNEIVYETIVPEMQKEFPRIAFQKGGEAKDMAEAAPAILGGMLIVVVMIYALLAIPFKSYVQPLIVISVIPFGIAGAIFGHLYRFQELSLLSGLGIIAMTGVVVNDSLVLVERINSLRASGMSLFDAVTTGGKERFRAIMLTSVTTFVGLVPILGETSLQAQFLIPMATSLAFGVLFATVITLFLVPCIYLVLEDLKWLLGLWWRGFSARFRSA